MRKISEQCKRTFSAILAAVMVLTSAPGTTMTAMAEEQTDAIETVVDSEEITVDDTDLPDDAEKAALDGEEENPDKGIMDEEGDPIKLSNPVIEMTPEDGKVANRGEASFKISGLQSNSQVYYVIGDKNVPAADVKDPTAEDASYLMSAIEVSAPDTDDEATVVVKAISIPTGSYAANYTSSDVVVETFTFAAKDESQDTEVPAAPGITFKVGDGILAEGSTVPFGTKVSMELTAAEGANIYYTLDGKFPTKESTAYDGSVELSSTAEGGQTITVRAIAVVNDKNSEVAMSTIVFAANAGIEAPTAPTITLKNGDDVLEEGAKVAFGTKVSMELAAAENTEIYYTIDGNNPTEASVRYTEAVELSSDKEEGETVTVKAIAVAEDKTSEVAIASVTFEAKVKTVKIDFIGDWSTFSCNLVPGDSDVSAHWVKGEGYILANENAQ